MSLQDFVPTPRFEEYRETFRDFYRMERRDDGVLLVAAHTLGGPVQLSVQNHRSLGQMLKTVGADPDNEVLILTGSGEEFMMASDPEGFALEEADMEHWAYEYAYKDGRINVSALVNDVEIPTIGVMNGPGFHSEIVLMCDITLAAEDAVIFDLHYDIGSVPADGIHNAFQELLGVKRGLRTAHRRGDQRPAGPGVGDGQRGGAPRPADPACLPAQARPRSRRRDQGLNRGRAARWVSPPLTTVRQPLADMGRVAAEMLGDLIEGIPLRSQRVELSTELIVRESTAGWRA